jgi:hypothetical protein
MRSCWFVRTTPHRGKVLDASLPLEPVGRSGATLGFRLDHSYDIAQRQGTQSLSLSGSREPWG